MSRALPLLLVAALGAAWFGLPVGDLAGGLGFALGLAMIGGHLVGAPALTARLGPWFMALFVTSLMWNGLAQGLRALVAGLVTSPTVWALVLIGVGFALLSALVLSLAAVTPEPVAERPERPTTRQRARIVDPLPADLDGGASAEPIEEFDFFRGGGRG